MVPLVVMQALKKVSGSEEQQSSPSKPSVSCGHALPSPQKSKHCDSAWSGAGELCHEPSQEGLALMLSPDNDTI